MISTLLRSTTGATIELDVSEIENAGISEVVQTPVAAWCMVDLGYATGADRPGNTFCLQTTT